jgi:hypothetical protein
MKLFALCLLAAATFCQADEVTYTNTRRLLFDVEGNQIDAYGSKINSESGEEGRLFNVQCLTLRRFQWHLLPLWQQLFYNRCSIWYQVVFLRGFGELAL